MSFESEFIAGRVQEPNVGTVAGLPPLAQSEATTDRESNERAFYAATFNNQGDFKKTHAQAKYDLDTVGSSDLVTDEEKTWENEQIGQNEDIMQSILTDPSIPKAQKNVILNTYRSGGYISKNLRDKYVQKTAAIDNADSHEDKDMQDLLSRALYNNYQKNKDLEIAIHEWENNLDPSAAGFAGGVARDFIPGVWNASNAASSAAAAKYFGYSNVEQFRAGAKAFFFGGTATRSIQQAFDSTLDPAQKKEFFLHLMEGAKQVPGFDYNQWSVLHSQIDNAPVGFWEEGFLNLVSIADAVGVGNVIRNPKQWFKGLYTYQDSALAQKIMSKVNPISKAIPQADRIDPTLAKQATDEQITKASSEPTGAENGVLDAKVETTNQPSDFVSAEENIRNVQPSVKPTSPIGLASMSNKKQARELDKSAIMSTQQADAMGTSKGEIVGSHLLPKLDDDFVKNNPDIAKDIHEMDKHVNELFEETNFDPFLVNVTERNDDKFKIFKAFSETTGAYYQQSNSSFRESLGAIEGKARYGRNADFGFTTIEQAEQAKKQVDESFVSTDVQDFKTNIINEFDQYYVEMDWKRTYDPFSARMFGIDSADSSFAGINTSGLTKGTLAKHVFPPTSRLPEWVTKGAFNATIQASKSEEQFLKIIKNEIRSTSSPAELQKASEWTLENQKWMSEADLSAMFPNLPQSDLKGLVRNYAFYKRLTEYDYLWADRKHTSDMLAEGFNRSIYNRNGELLGYARQSDQIPENVKQVWDFESNGPVQFTGTVDGKEVVKLRDPKRTQGNIYEYAAVGGGTKLDIMPQHTLSRIEGYISRRNIESWYVTSKPKSLKVNGTTLGAEDLKKYSKTIGAGRTRAETELLAQKMQKESPDDIIDIKQERGDIGDSILTDYKVYKEMTDYGKKRGERLPTLTGQARLEDPLVQQTKSIQSIVRLNAWSNYTEIFQKNYLGAYSKFLPNGRFPNVLTDLKLIESPSPKDLDDFKVAQRLFEQYSNQQYKINYGDEIWKDSLHKIADVVENSKLAGQADNIREIANKGNLGLKSVKSLANTLFINLNSMAQWIVQPQSILEFMAVEKGFRAQVGMIPGLMIHMLAKASDVKPYRKAMETIASSFIGDKGEFKAIANAIYKSGLPQSVDMNMMLHGGLDDMSKSLRPGLSQHVGNTIAYIPDAVNKFGKAIGYTPAQMMADIGGWLFAKARWQRMNPGKNWNTPEHIAQITADGWDIMGSMHTRAGAMPYQDGFMSLFFQFQAILHKQFFNTFSSKTLKKAPGEVVDPKVKLAAARMAIYGMYGLPAFALVDHLVTEMANSDSQADWQKYKGGLLDLATNTTLDLLLSDPNAAPMDLALSDRIGPMPETLPYYDVMHELVRFSFGGKSETRIPFVNATGSVYEAARDFTNIFRSGEVETPDAFIMAATEAAEMASGYKNYVKARMVMDMNDKADKFNKNLGVELTMNHAVAQMFGVVSKQELAMYKMQENKKERDEFIEQRAAQIHQDLVKFRTKLGTPDFMEWVRRTKVLNTFTPDDLQEEVFARVLKKDREDHTSKQYSNIMYIRDNAKQKNDKYIEEMLGYLKSCGSTECQQNLKRLVDNNIVKGTE